MRLTWTSELPDEGDLREQWNALVLRMEKPEVFYTWEWVAAVTRSYRASLPPWIVTAFDGEDLVGVAALAKTSATEVAFLAGTTADYCDFVSDPGKRHEFIGGVLRDLRESGIRRVVLANLPADSATAAAVRGNESFRSFLRTGYVCGQVRLGSEQERQELARSFLKKKMFRRSLNALKRIGRVSLRHDCVNGVEAGGLDAFCASHVARFLATGRLSNLVAKERREFLYELAQLLVERKWFDLMNLYAGQKLVASNYGFRFQGSWFWYQPTIVNQFEHLSPGFCLLTRIVEDASKDPDAQVVDLGLGAEGYKERFANAQRTTLHATLSRDALDIWRARGRYHAAQAIQSQPRLEPIARQIQRAAQRGRERSREGGWTSALAWAVRRVGRSLASTHEVRLFQWEGGAATPPGRALAPLSWEILSSAAMCYADDRETLDYLLRAAGRFHSKTHAGFTLLGESGSAQHFAFVAPYEGFAMAELGEILRAPSPGSVMIYDCWTPRELRGQGLYGHAIEQLAARLSAEGKDVWIFGAATNSASLAGIEKAGFQPRFTMVKRKVLGWAKTRRESAGARVLKPAAPLSKEAVR